MDVSNNQIQVNYVLKIQPKQFNASLKKLEAKLDQLQKKYSNIFSGVPTGVASGVVGATQNVASQVATSVSSVAGNTKRAASRAVREKPSVTPMIQVGEDVVERKLFPDLRLKEIQKHEELIRRFDNLKGQTVYGSAPYIGDKWAKNIPMFDFSSWYRFQMTWKSGLADLTLKTVAYFKDFRVNLKNTLGSVFRSIGSGLKKFFTGKTHIWSSIKQIGFIQTTWGRVSRFFKRFMTGFRKLGHVTAVLFVFTHALKRIADKFEHLAEVASDIAESMLMIRSLNQSELGGRTPRQYATDIVERLARDPVEYANYLRFQKSLQQTGSRPSDILIRSDVSGQDLTRYDILRSMKLFIDKTTPGKPMDIHRLWTKITLPSGRGSELFGAAFGAILTEAKHTAVRELGAPWAALSQQVKGEHISRTFVKWFDRQGVDVLTMHEDYLRSVAGMLQSYKSAKTTAQARGLHDYLVPYTNLPWLSDAENVLRLKQLESASLSVVGALSDVYGELIRVQLEYAGNYQRDAQIHVNRLKVASAEFSKMSIGVIGEMKFWFVDNFLPMLEGIIYIGTIIGRIVEMGMMLINKVMSGGEEVEGSILRWLRETTVSLENTTQRLRAFLQLNTLGSLFEELARNIASTLR